MTSSSHTPCSTSTLKVGVTYRNLILEKISLEYRGIVEIRIKISAIARFCALLVNLERTYPSWTSRKGLLFIILKVLRTILHLIRAFIMNTVSGNFH
jgi:hypothetical protein